jgi:hypothetical protein
MRGHQQQETNMRYWRYILVYTRRKFLLYFEPEVLQRHDLGRHRSFVTKRVYEAYILAVMRYNVLQL